MSKPWLWCRLVCQPGSKVLQITAPLTKAAALAALCCIAALVDMASVLILTGPPHLAVQLGSQIQSVVESVDQGLFTGHSVRILSNSADDWALLQRPRAKDSFQQGRVTLIVPASVAALQHLHSFMEQAQPKQLLLLADDADQLWTFYAAPQQHPQHVQITQQETQLYHLLTCSSLHGLVQVSTTACPCPAIAVVPAQSAADFADDYACTNQAQDHGRPSTRPGAR